VKGPREAVDREHFDSIADRYAAKDLAPSSRIARRHRFYRTVAALPVDAFERVLDVGCGAGFGADYLRGRYEDYIGIDHSRRLIEVAAEKNSGTGVRFETSSIDAYDPPHRFDLIVMIGVLHHLEDPARSMKTMAPWLEPGGYLVANEPQPANSVISAARRARAHFDASYSSEQEEISAAELRALFVGAGLEGISITPQGLVSTPFSELVLKPFAVTTPLARFACAVDGLIERRSGPWLGAVSWNLIGCGRAPTSATG
jgi:2-polyprenyl-3-methyl-5-hydroxy-6-metoxy-1,4-benzoquinol methylase